MGSERISNLILSIRLGLPKPLRGVQAKMTKCRFTPLHDTATRPLGHLCKAISFDFDFTSSISISSRISTALRLVSHFFGSYEICLETHAARVQRVIVAMKHLLQDACNYSRLLVSSCWQLIHDSFIVSDFSTLHLLQIE